MTSGFFDVFDRFLTTSETSAQPVRLNARHSAIFSSLGDCVRGARVLDIASHDGRWAFAALQAGAGHVTGVEPRAELIANAKATFEHYGVSQDRYEFVADDIFAHLSKNEPRSDVVLCLGFLYHTFRHVELFAQMANSKARTIIIDTEIVPRSLDVLSQPQTRIETLFANQCLLQLFKEPVDRQEMAAKDNYTRDGHTIVARPSASAINLISAHFGYDVSYYDWPSALSHYPTPPRELADYASGWRTTLACRA